MELKVKAGIEVMLTLYTNMQRDTAATRDTQIQLDACTHRVRYYARIV